MANRGHTDVKDNPSASRYEIRVDGELAGFARYRLEGDRLVFFDTQVDPAHRGKGLGQELAEAALQGARAQGRAVEPRCEFIADYVGRHPEHRDLVVGAAEQDLRPAA